MIQLVTNTQNLEPQYPDSKVFKKWTDQMKMEEEKDKDLSYGFVRNRWPVALENLVLPGDGRRNVRACNKHFKSSIYSMDLECSAHQQCVIRWVEQVKQAWGR